MQKFIVLFVALTLILALFLLVSKSRESVEFAEPEVPLNP